MKFKISCTSKETIKKSEETGHEMGKKSQPTTHQMEIAIKNKFLKTAKIKSQKSNNLLSRWVDELDRQFSK